MKKIVTLFAAILCAALVFGQSYGILVNGNTYFAGEAAGQNEGFTQYLAHVQVNAGDYCQLYDASNEASWVVPLNTWSTAGFTLNNDRYEVTVSGCFDFYIKLKYGADELYIGAGSNCGSGTPIGGGETPETPETPSVTRYHLAGNGTTGSAWCCGAAWNPNGCLLDSATGSITYQNLPAGYYSFKITDGTWDNVWGYDAVSASCSSTGYTADNDGNVCFTTSDAGAVTIQFDGTNICLTAEKIVFSSSVPAEAPDVMLQGFYWDSYNAQGKAYGDTRWTTLLGQAEEINSYFDLVWLPPASFSTGGTGYIPRQYSNLSGDWGTSTELHSLIDALHNGNTRVVADIVINHCGNYSSSCNFYPLDFGTYGSFQPDNTWVTTNDEGNCGGGSHADVGYEGEENYGSARDWDHQSTNVQAMCRAYLQWMKAQGFDGWRYDYGKGYTHDHINDYNTAAGAYFSVVEYWDGNAENIRARLNDANWNTTYFDFSTKYNVLRDGISAGNYSKCQGQGLLGAGLSKYAVTFVDNHDTYGTDSEFGGSGNSMTAAKKDLLLQANAYILSMPGIPCVFYPHWYTYKAELKKMIEARHLTGVHSESAVYDEQVSATGYQATIAGKNGYIVLQLGDKATGTIANFTKYAHGNGYAIWIHTNDAVVEPETNYTYYIKNNWNGGDWAWKPMILSADSLTCTYAGIFGGLGVNINDQETDGGEWYPIANMIIAEGAQAPQANDSVLFTYTLASGQLAAQVLNRPEADPEQQDTTSVTPVEEHYYLVGSYNTWSPESALEFENMDSLYSITIANFSGEFKVIDARDWRHGIYGAYTEGDVINLGGEYALVAQESQNLAVSGVHTEATFHLKKQGDFLVLYFVSGTSEQQDTTVTPDPEDQVHFYITGNAALVGQDKEWNPAAIPSMTDTFTLNLEANIDYILKVTMNGTWQGENNVKGYGELTEVTPGLQDISDDHNIGFRLSVPGAVQVIYNNTTFVVLGSFVTETVSQLPTVAIAGSMNSWDQNANVMVVADDSLSASVKMNLTAQDYYFKVVVDGQWRCYLGIIYDITRTNDTLVNVVDEGGLDDNFNLKADAAGEYTFTWIYATNTLIVTFPEGQIVETPKFYITGNAALVGQDLEWNPAAIPSMTDTCTLNLEANIDYILKVTMNGTWQGENNVKGYGELTEVTPGLQDISDDHNIGFRLSVPGTVQVVYNDTTFLVLGRFVVPEPVVEPKPTYYIKNNWNGGDWTWEQMEAVNQDSTVWSFARVFGGGGVNINTTDNDEGARWIPVDSMNVGDVIPAAMDSVVFLYFTETNILSAQVVERPEVDPQPEIPTITVYTVKPTAWRALNAYVWNEEEVELAGWPGIAMTNTGLTFRDEAIYSCTFPNIYTKIIFNNGASDQTSDLNIDTTALCYYYGEWYASFDDVPSETPEIQDITVYTVMPAGWEALNAFVWIGNYNYVQWPGEAMTKTNDTFRGDTVYSYTFPNSYANIIFNDGNGTQTHDIILDATKRYYYGDTWYASWDEVPEDIVILPAKYYATGNANLVVAAGLSPEYADDAAAIKATSDTLLLNLLANTEYKLKLTLTGTWTRDVKDFYNLTERTPGLTADANAYICFTMAQDGQVMIIYNDSVFTVTGNFVVPEPVEDITIYTVKPADWQNILAFVWNDENGAYNEWPGEAMTKTNDTFRGDTVYSYTFPGIYTKVIFNNNDGNQTPDLILDATKRYYYGDIWYASWDEVPEDVVILPAKYYAAGNENLVVAAGLSVDYAYDAAAIKATSDTLLLNLYANMEYKLKLTLTGTWARDVRDFYDLTSVTPGLTADFNAYICFTMAQDGQVMIIYNDSVFTVTGNFVVPEPVIEPKATYYIKNNWDNTGDDPWTWEQMYALDTDSTLWGYTRVFGGLGVNIATDPYGAEELGWYPVEMFIINEGDLIPQAGDTVYFVYNTLQDIINAIVIGRPSTEPGPEPQPEAAFYLVGTFNGWNVQTAIPFTEVNSVYTLTMDTLQDAFKVLTARSWDATNYGAYNLNDELTIGEPYTMLVSGDNFFSSTVYLNAVLEVHVVGEAVTLTLVSGTPYVAPLDERHFYLIGEFNNWEFATAPEFAYADSAYTITIDTIAGAFKVTGARNWDHGNYGAYTDGDVLNLGGEYNMASQNAQNLTFSKAYTNVTLRLTVAEDVVTIYFVSGTPVQDEPTNLDLIPTGQTLYKVIENGTLYIYRDGTKYNANGQVVR